jgi:hypothetical protein
VLNDEAKSCLKAKAFFDLVQHAYAYAYAYISASTRRWGFLKRHVPNH